LHHGQLRRGDFRGHLDSRQRDPTGNDDRAWSAPPPAYGAANNIQFQNITYYLTNLAGQYFIFEAAGQDVTSRFYLH
jgi:hypothetical protein